MFGYTFYNGTVRKITVAFGSLFNNITIQRKDNNQDVQKQIKVPIAYSPSQQWLTRLRQKTSIDDQTEVEFLLPRMGFEIQNMQFDSTRKLDPYRKIHGKTSDGSIVETWNRIPYTLNYQLYIAGKNTEDCLQIVEQILPYFKPELFISIRDMDDFGITTDIPITLDDISIEDNYEDGFDELRMIVWTLSFSIRCYFYANTAPGKIIYKANANIFNDPEMTNKTVEIDEIVHPTGPSGVVTGVLGPDPEDSENYIIVEVKTEGPFTP